MIENTPWVLKNILVEVVGIWYNFIAKMQIKNRKPQNNIDVI